MTIGAMPGVWRAWRLCDPQGRCPAGRGSTGAFEVGASILRDGTASAGTALPIVSTGASVQILSRISVLRRRPRRRSKLEGPIPVGWATIRRGLECRRTHLPEATIVMTRRQSRLMLRSGRDRAARKDQDRTPGRASSEKRTRGPTEDRRMRCRSTRSTGAAEGLSIAHAQNTASTAREAPEVTLPEAHGADTSPKRRRGRRARSRWRRKMNT